MLFRNLLDRCNPIYLYLLYCLSPRSSAFAVCVCFTKKFSAFYNCKIQNAVSTVFAFVVFSNIDILTVIIITTYKNGTFHDAECVYMSMGIFLCVCVLGRNAYMVKSEFDVGQSLVTLHLLRQGLFLDLDEAC